jgi:guanylate kinase
MNSPREGITFVLSAPSGTGKTTVCKALRQKIPALKFSISHTTRSPRPEEKEGEAYYFISNDEFEKKIAQGGYLEWAKVFDHYYGTSVESANKGNEGQQNLLIELDVQGAQTLRKNNFPGVFIFLLPPSLEELAIRLKKRDTDSIDKINQRLATGKQEIKNVRLYDYVITNVDIDETVQTIQAIMNAEACRTARFDPSSDDIRSLLKSVE